MAQASITIYDDADGKITVAADFGEAFEINSQAHQMISVLLESVLGNAKNYQKIEDTAPELDAEPSKIVVPNQGE